MATRITLIIPGLGTVPDAPAPVHRLPGFDRLLRLASIVEAPRDLDTLAWHRAGGTGACAAVAPVTRLADTGRQDADWWIRADPVCLVAGAADAALVPRPGPTAGEAARLSAVIGDHLSSEGYAMESPTADRWYLRSPVALDARTVSPLHAARSGVTATLPSGPDGGRLCALMNEAQMLLHDHAVNQARASRALPAINSIWLWGGGRMPAPDSLAGDRPALASSHPYPRGVWALAGAGSAPAPDSFETLDADQDDRLVVLDGADRPLPELDRAWIEPLVAHVLTGRIDVLEVIDDGVCVVLRRASEGRWLRRLGARLRPAHPRWPWST